MSNTKEHANRYIPALDGLRALAILFVLITHEIDDVPHRLQRAASAGWSGVDLFFVLSGFLITGGLLKTKTATNYFRSFYGRRMLRIFPVFYLALAIAFGVLPHFLPSPPLPPPHDYIFYWLYLNNWAPLMDVVNTQYVGHFWSLAVEEQFYLAWPAVVLWLSRKHLGMVALLGFVSAPLLRVSLLLSGVQIETIYRNTFSRLDSLMIGALCALIVSEPEMYRWVKKVPGLLLLTGLTVWLFFLHLFGESYNHPKMIAAGLTVNAVCFGLILLGCVSESKWTVWLTAKPLRLIGVWSYGIYVYHLAFVHLVHMHTGFRPGLVRLSAAALMAIGTAALSYRFFESPILHFKSHFAPVWAGKHELDPSLVAKV